MWAILERKMGLKSKIRFIFICFLIGIICLFCFFNTRYFEPWCHEDESFLVYGITSEELIKKVRNYYYSNKDIWVWDKNKGNEYSLASEYYTPRNWIPSEEIKILINDKIYHIRIPRTEVVRIEIHGIYNSKIENRDDKKYICASGSIGEINRLNRTEENNYLVKEFEDQFIKKLDVNYIWQEPPLVNVLFRKMYISLH